MVSLETGLTCERLKRRHQAAWWRTRRVRPVVGITFDLDQAVFEPHSTVEAAKQWVAKTCQVVTNTTVSDVYLAHSRQPLDTPIMTLVVDPARGGRGCVFKTSHTLVSHEGFRVMQEYMTQLACPDNELGIDAVFLPETASEITPRLPQSLCHAYSLRYQLTQEESREVLQAQQRAQERWARSSIGVPLRPDWQYRQSYIHNKTVTFEPGEALAAFQYLKKVGISLTAAFFACITSGIAQTFGTGAEEGAHLLYSGNARRWFDIEGGGGLGPITMSIIPGGMWIDASQVDVRAKDRQGLMELAKAIRQAQEQDLVSPHIIAIYDHMAPALAKAMGEPQGPSSVPSVGRPTLTSQGHFDDYRLASPDHDQIRMADFNTGGRNTDPNVCFALNSFRDELRFNLLFDERFFIQDDVMRLAYVVSGLFRRLTLNDPVQAKL